MNGTAASWVLTWFFTVQHPGGELTHHVQAYANRYTFSECVAQRDEFARIIWLKDITPDGGDAVESRFECLPAPD